MGIIAYEEQRVGVFIDIENLYYSAKKLFGARVNFRQVLKDVVGPRKLVRAIAYVIKTETGEERPFFEALSRLGIEIREKELQVYGGFKKADWDVGLAVDAIKVADSLDVIIIFSGDGDFLPLVEYLKNLGKQVEIAAFSKSSSRKLKEAVDRFFDIGSSAKYFYRK
jgi:uncharacterized LabA/DUF88 family protein